MQDPDLRQLRDRREWLDATENMKGGVSKTGLVELRSEAKAPFRLIRMFLTFGAGAAAVVSLGITLFALKGVLQGQLKSQIFMASSVTALSLLFQSTKEQVDAVAQQLKCTPTLAHSMSACLLRRPESIKLRLACVPCPQVVVMHLT